MAENRGGKRPGAGRKHGSLTEKTRAIAAKAAAEGITPLEVMISAMRGYVEMAERAGNDMLACAAMMERAAAVAKDAAPYMHPRLAAIEHSGNLSINVAQELAALNGSPEGVEAAD